MRCIHSTLEHSHQIVKINTLDLQKFLKIKSYQRYKKDLINASEITNMGGILLVYVAAHITNRD